MKLKAPKSFRKSKKKGGESVGTSTDPGPSDPGPSAPPSPDAAAGPAAVQVTPPSTPRDGVAEARQDSDVIPGSPMSGGANVVPPSPPSAGSGKKGASAGPLRLGSFDFDAPEANVDPHSGLSTPQTTLTFPPLFREADDMLALSNLVYALAELRELARNGVLNDPAASSRILDVPLPLETAGKIVKAESGLLREVLDDGKHEATLGALEGLLARQEEGAVAKEDDKARKKTDSDGGMFGWLSSWDGCLAGGFSFDELNFCGDMSHVLGENTPPTPVQPESSVITYVGDLKSEGELVYAVGVNPVEERITIAFRGSVTKTDFKTDAKIAIVAALDPRAFNGTTSELDKNVGGVGVHQGFYEYLMGEPKGRQSKYAEIMKHVTELYRENPARKNYKLYVTGHSLGGALATLFGFYAAASPLLPLPVTVVSVASPRVGNLAFARTFAELESLGKLRHLRICNHKDPVTLGPTVSSKRALALSAKAFSPLGYLALAVSGNGEGGKEEVYFHTGMKMKLYRNVSAVGSQRCELSYSGATIVAGAKKPVAIDRDDMAEIEQSNKRKKKDSSAEMPLVSYHFGTSYAERMAAAESDLRGFTLNGMYKEKAGHLT
ncbi:hypothetical protein ACHAXT_008767 [Thalassiosira profunda]